MMLEYDWENQTAAATAALLFGEEAGQPRQLFDHYGQYGDLTRGDTSAEQHHQQLMAAVLRHGMGPPPPPAPAASIGLNLGGRTYFSSREEGGVCRRPAVHCRAAGCGAELSEAKHYHRRHKVCEFHSKASVVVLGGLSQRFCQQCSRFHVLSEFDEEKRSCRKRLADHNRRRRKPPATTSASASPITAAHAAISTSKSHNPKKIMVTASSSRNNHHIDRATTTSSMAPRMGVGLGHADVVAVQESGNLASSSSIRSTPSGSFMSDLIGLRGHNWFQIGRG